MCNDLVLIGSLGAGKTTVSKLLAEQVGLPHRCMDDLRWTYFKEIGYDEDLAKQKRQSEGVWGLCQYWKPFEVHAIERLLSEHQNCVFDLSGGCHTQTDSALLERVYQALAPYNTVLLMPSPDLDESLQILNERENYVSDVHRNANEHFLKHPSNYLLAKFVVFTQGKTPRQTCDKILSLVGAKMPRPYDRGLELS
jgi:hypothetical protein